MTATQTAMDCAVMDAKNFAKRLRQLRVAAGLNQSELAERSGLSQPAIARLEAGLRAPAWETVLALADALDVECTAFRVDPATQPTPPPTPKGRPRKPRPDEG